MSRTVIIATEDEVVVVLGSEDETNVIQGTALRAEVVQATGSGTLYGNFFRGIINYDGGRAGTDYGDLIHLDGGEAPDGSRYSI